MVDPGSCSTDSDCQGILICDTGICVMPSDGGRGMKRDGGSVTDAGSVAVDAGEEVDAGMADAGSMCVPSLELCNGVDDDCDGIIDNAARVSSLDGGALQFDGGVAMSNGMCTVGVGACASMGMTSCSSGSLVCSGMASTPGVERCNQIDDDCDGQTDENDPGICSVTGQSCNAGACACPSGQSVCHGACATLGVEVCDGQDNDCDGQVDEGVTITCLSDTDGDGYATDATTSQQCADSSRAQFGSCPIGFVAPANSTGTDCSPTDASKYRLVSSRNDSDVDGYCAGSATNDCVGTMALTGRKFATDCSSLNDDCDDARSDRYRFIASRNDADGDTYCTVDAATMDCAGAQPLPGRRFATQCAASVDCDDGANGRYQLLPGRVDLDGDAYCASAIANVCSGAQLPTGWKVPNLCVGGTTTTDCDDLSVTTFRLATTARDADNDAYCTSTGAQQCIGLNPPSGYRMANTCNTSNLDCNDNDGSLVRNVSLRADADRDGWCSGNAYTACVGPSAPAPGTQYATSCLGDDCSDTNGNATSACSFTGFSDHIKACGAGLPATNDIGFTFDCGTGFHYSSIGAIGWVSGDNVSTESLFSVFGAQSGTITIRSTCNPGLTVGQKGIRVVHWCSAD